MAQMKVLNKGFLVTLQDQGRSQCQQLGLAEAGALDKHAFFWANRILGNPPETPALEILVGNTSFTFDAPTTIAITGADMGVKLNGTVLPHWRTTRVNSGDTLQFGIMKNGLRAYLAVAGGFTVPTFFESASTMIREKTGGTHGDKLDKGDLVPYPAGTNVATGLRVPERYIPNYDEELVLRFTPGYHFDEFDTNSVKECLASPYKVTNDADRMGYRLAGPAFKRDKGNILSIGVPCGAIQIPSAGEPIILLNDRQCTGGYPILGVIASRDIYRLAQRKGENAVRFEIADPADLRREQQEFYNFFYNNEKI